MTFARGAAVNGEWLLPGALDKPPLSIYHSALSMVFFGNTADAAGVLQLDIHIGEFAGRLPNALLGIALAALMMRLAGKVHGDATAALLAGVLTAISPFTIVYGASAFTDMTLLFCSAGALYCAASGRWALAGSALGLAFWSKQQAIFPAAFIGLFWLALGAKRRDGIRLGLPLGVMVAALLIWDGARPEASLFAQAAANNAPAQWLAQPSAWMDRSIEWARMAGWLMGPPAVTVALLAAALVSRWRGPLVAQAIPMRPFERLAVASVIAYALVHVVFNFNLYERYLFLIAPLVILAVSGRLAMLYRSERRGRLLASAGAVIILAGAMLTLGAGTPLEAERRENAGIDRLAAQLKGKPVATVIYDPWLGWQLGYYLGQWHDKRRAHYPTAEALVAGALALEETGERYFVAPIDQPHDDWLATLGEAGFAVAEDYRRDRFVLYRLTPPAA